MDISQDYAKLTSAIGDKSIADYISTNEIIVLTNLVTVSRHVT